MNHGTSLNEAPKSGTYTYLIGASRLTLDTVRWFPLSSHPRGRIGIELPHLLWLLLVWSESSSRCFCLL